MTMPGPVLRFAPSPNGLLHLGHAFSALFTARAAAALGGAFVLRIEDIDPGRSKLHYETALIEDLSWLGITWNEPVLRQSTRMAAYAAAAMELKSKDLLYPCLCSRREIAQFALASDPDGKPLYAGTCRHLPESEICERLENGEQAQWRLKMDQALKDAGSIMISEAPAPDRDALWSEAVQRQARPAHWGDAVLLRKEIPTSYHLSVVVDDAAQGITHVTRGRDLFAATSLHVLLQRLLGLPSPVYSHHRILVDHGGQKLAKSRMSLSLRSLRQAGKLAGDIRQQLGFD